MTRTSAGLSAIQRRSFLWAAAVAILLFSVAEQSVEFLLLVGVGVACAWVLSVQPGKPLPRVVINTGVFGVVVLAAIQMLRLGVGVSAFAYFVGMLLVVKLFDLRSARDWGQTLVLASGLTVAAVLTSNSMLTGVLLVIETVLLLRAVMRYQLFVAMRRADAAHVRMTRLSLEDLRSIQIGAGFVIAVLGTLVFLVLPRNLGSDAFGNWGGASGAQVSGFSDEVELGRAGVISQSSTPVMDVSVVDSDGEGVGALDGTPIYLRGAVLNRYERGRWSWRRESLSRAVVRSSVVQEGEIVRPFEGRVSGSWDLEIRVSVRKAPRGLSPAFAMWEPIEFQSVGETQLVEVDPINGLITREGRPSGFDYIVRSRNPRLTRFSLTPGAVRSTPPPTEIDPKVLAFATEVVADAGLEPDPALRSLENDVRVVRVLENYLQARFKYTLEDAPTPRGRDATEWFLSERQEGHCEYYASALALLCRSLGINSRVVTGYVATDFNEVSEQYVVRQSNAHAWTEVEVAPGTWWTFDATPRAEFHQIHQPEPSFMRSVKQFYETIEFAWASGVVAYDSDTRSQIFGGISTDFGLRGLSGALVERLRSRGAGLMGRAIVVAAFVFVGSMLVGRLVQVYWVSITRLIRAAWSGVCRRLLGWTVAVGRRRDQQLERLHRLSLRVLAQAGHAKPSSIPLRSHLAVVGADLSDQTQVVLSAACDEMYQSRYAGTEGTAAGTVRVQELIRLLGECLTKTSGPRGGRSGGIASENPATTSRR